MSERNGNDERKPTPEVKNRKSQNFREESQKAEFNENMSNQNFGKRWRELTKNREEDVIDLKKYIKTEMGV